MLSIDPTISEGFKWNSASYRTSEFFATLNLRCTDQVQFVFHTGAKVKASAKAGVEVADPASLCEWLAKDCCLVSLGAGKQITAKLPARDRRFVDRVRLARDGFDYSVIRSNYDYHFGGIARRLRRPVDHAAALVCLQNNRRFLEEIQAKYPVNDPYWPPLMAPYSLLNLDEEIKKHEGK